MMPGSLNMISDICIKGSISLMRKKFLFVVAKVYSRHHCHYPVQGFSLIRPTIPTASTFKKLNAHTTYRFKIFPCSKWSIISFCFLVDEPIGVTDNENTVEIRWLARTTTKLRTVDTLVQMLSPKLSNQTNWADGTENLNATVEKKSRIKIRLFGSSCTFHPYHDITI